MSTFFPSSKRSFFSNDTKSSSEQIKLYSGHRHMAKLSASVDWREIYLSIGCQRSRPVLILLGIQAEDSKDTLPTLFTFVHVVTS